MTGMKNSKQQPNTVFKTPFSASYWRLASGELKKLPMLVLAAMLIALTSAIGALYIPVTESLRIKFTFLITATGSMIYGPVIGIATGIIGDIVSYLLAPSGPFFPGYTLSAVLSSLVYALFLYRAKVTPLRIFAAKAIVNIFVNAMLGSLWNIMLRGKGYIFYLTTSGIKNLLLLPVEATVLILLFSAILPFLRKEKLVPADTKVKLSIGFIIFSVIFSVLCFIGLIYCVTYLSIFAK